MLKHSVHEDTKETSHHDRHGHSDHTLTKPYTEGKILHFTKHMHHLLKDMSIMTCIWVFFEKNVFPVNNRTVPDPSNSSLGKHLMPSSDYMYTTN